jgi:uncharacterized protein (DUF2141 family)
MRILTQETAIKIGILILALMLPSTFSAACPEQHTLTVVAEGVRNSRGVVGVLVFDSQKGWPEDVSAATWRKAVNAQKNSTVVTIPGLPSGDYAVVVLHDENENQVLDRNWLGIPAEQWGMSNNPDYFLSAPSFEQARFTFQSDTRIHVVLH